MENSEIKNAIKDIREKANELNQLIGQLVVHDIDIEAEIRIIDRVIIDAGRVPQVTFRAKKTEQF